MFKKIVLILSSIFIIRTNSSSEDNRYHCWPKGKLFVITYQHQMIPQFDTIFVRHYRRLNCGKFYVLPLKGEQLIVDNIRQVIQKDTTAKRK